MAGWPAQLATRAFSQLSMPTDCYAGLAVFFPSGSRNHR